MVSKTVSADVSPFALFLSLRDRPHPFILDSAMDPDKLGRYSFAGADPFLTFKSKGDTCRITRRDGHEETHYGDPFEFLRGLLREYPQEDSGRLPFAGGAVGYFGYDLCHFIERLPRKAIDDIETPDSFFGFYDGIYLFDHQTGMVDMVTLGIDGDPSERLEQMEEHLRRVFIEGPRVAPYHSLEPFSFRTNMTKETYLKAVERIRAYIRDGDIYQANFTQRFDAPFTGDPFAFYQTLRSVNPAPFAAYIDTGESVVLSSSPERFIRVHQGKIETRPIKGTYPRGATVEEDEKNKAELAGSEKNRAELLMIVDLERNDLGRIALPGTVAVPELFTLETYATVHHLVATITAEVRPDCDLIDCIRATFPGGSITGAPKIRAMEIIDELEPTQRSVYTGSMGYLGFDGSMDLNIAIRTVLIKDNRAYFQVGGGIVWDSDPQEEYEESLIKARALMEALRR